MSVTFDAVGPSSSGYAVNAPGTAPSWTHTAGASATLLIAWITIDGQASQTVTCKAGTTAMTASAANPVNNNGSSFAYAFYLFSPPTGSVTVAFTLQSTPGGYVAGGSLSFAGAASLGTPVTVSGTQTGSSMTLTVSGVASTSMVAGFMSLGDAPVAPSTGTNRFEANGAGSSGNTDGNAAGATNAGTGSVSITWSGLPSGDSHCGWAAEVLAPAAAIAPGALIQAQLQQPPVLLVPPQVISPAPTEKVTAPGYASAASDLANGSGSWTSPASADGAPDGSYATWAVP